MVKLLFGGLPAECFNPKSKLHRKPVLLTLPDISSISNTLFCEFNSFLPASYRKSNNKAELITVHETEATPWLQFP